MDLIDTGNGTIYPVPGKVCSRINNTGSRFFVVAYQKLPDYSLWSGQQQQIEITEV